MYRVLILSAALLAATPAPAAEALPSLGMFVAWAQKPDKTDLGGREANLRVWEERLRLPDSSLHAIDFYGDESWSGMTSAAWLPGYWAQRNPGRRLIWSIPLTMKGTPLKDVADGRRDAEFKAAAQAIAAAQPGAAIRIGWEMNGDWYPWASAGKEGDYIAAWRRVAGLFRAASPRFSFDWCPGGGLGGAPPEQAYPGDDVVDTISLDVYDTPSEKPAQRHWREDVLEAPDGLRWLEDFSARHGKKMAIGEWGVGLRGARDNPVFVDAMAGWLRRNAPRLAYHVYFDVTPHDLDSGAFPKSRERFLAAFSAASAPKIRRVRPVGPAADATKTE